MAEHRLLNPFTSVDKNGILTFGGDQTRAESAAICKCGCGIVAAADLFIYMCRYHGRCRARELSFAQGAGAVRLGDYNALLSALNRAYFPLLPPFGINGVALVGGINLFFMRHAWPYRAQWGVRYGALWTSIEKMLDNDLPVIIAVGPNLPRFWQNNQAALYTRLPDGSYKKIGAVKAHFMSVTAIDAEWLTVSSWGRRYYIRRCEYDAYVRAHSNGLVCNIAYIKAI